MQHSLKKALREMQSDSKITVPRPAPSSPFLKDRGSLTEACKLSGIKRAAPECPQSSPHHHSVGGSGTNGHLVYARRKSEQESAKSNYCDKDKFTKHPQQENGKQETPLERTQNEVPKRSCFSAHTPIPKISSMTTSSGGPTVSSNVKSPTEMPPTEPNLRSNTPAVSCPSNYFDKDTCTERPQHEKSEQETPLEGSQNEGSKHSSLSAYTPIPKTSSTTTSSGPSVPSDVKSPTELPSAEPNRCSNTCGVFCPSNYFDKDTCTERQQQEKSEQETPRERTQNEGSKYSSLSAYTPIPKTSSTTTSSGGPSVPSDVKSPTELPSAEPNRCSNTPGVSHPVNYFDKDNCTKCPQQEKGKQETPRPRTQNEGTKHSSFSAYTPIPKTSSMTTSSGGPSLPSNVKPPTEFPPTEPNLCSNTPGVSCQVNYFEKDKCTKRPRQENWEQEAPRQRTQNEWPKNSSVSTYTPIPKTSSMSTSSGEPSVPSNVKSPSELPSTKPNICSNTPAVSRLVNYFDKANSTERPQQEKGERETPRQRTLNEGPTHSCFPAYTPIPKTSTTSSGGPSLPSNVKPPIEFPPTEPKLCSNTPGTPCPVNYSDKDNCTKRLQRENREQETPRQRTQNEWPKHSCLSAYAPISKTSSMTTSSGGPSIPSNVKPPTEMPPIDPNFCSNTPGVSRPVNSQKMSILYWKERFLRLQTQLRSIDHSNQEDYIKMLRSLSSAARSKHAVELEKRAIQLLLEEGHELQRMKVLDVLGKYVPHESSSDQRVQLEK